jgi:hypothetical protein
MSPPRLNHGRSTVEKTQALDPLEKLTEVGFIKVGRWSLKSGKPCHSLGELAGATEVLYAFVSDRQVLYLGKTTKELRRRMYGYERPGPTQRTNIACHAKLLEVLTAKQAVDIYVFRDPEPKLHAGIPINLAVGLEDGLILELRPPWNKAGL